MLSIIVCSINNDLLNQLHKSIAETVDIPFELIAFDNSEKKWGICKVYNHCASRAKYDYLCFVHEDVIFITPGWGKIIVSQLKLPNCGVIGFAGSTFKSKSKSGWGSKNYNYFHYTEVDPAGNETSHHSKPSDDNSLFSHVVVLDGLCLFSTRKVWSENPFDETTLTGFHFYDLDFSLQIFYHYKNYVCHAVEIKHLSMGAYNPSWIEAASIFHKKWEERLPAYVTPPLKNSQIKRDEINSLRVYLRLLKKGTSPQAKAEIRNNIVELIKKSPFRKVTLKIIFNYFFRNRI